MAATSPSPHAPQAIDLLITRGKIPIDVKDALLGRTPLHALAARRRGQGGRVVGQGPAVLAALLRHGAGMYGLIGGLESNAADGKTPCPELCHRSNQTHKHNPPPTDINAPEAKHGSTPLHLAVAAGNLPLARVLLQHGADPTRRNRGGWTPLALAQGLRGRSNAAAAMVELLLAHAAGDEDEGVLLLDVMGGGEEGGQEEHENPLRFVKGPGAR